MKNKELTRTESRRICLFLLNLAVCAGILIGSFVVVAMGNDFLSDSPLLHQYFSPIFSGSTLLRVFLSTLLSCCAFIVAEFLLGFFSFGQAAAVVLLILRGIGMGAASAQLYIMLGFGGLLAVMVLIVPKALAVAFVTALGARESIKLANVQFRMLFTDKLPEESMKYTLKLYCIKFLVLILIMTIIAAGDSAMNYFFIDLL